MEFSHPQTKEFYNLLRSTYKKVIKNKNELIFMINLYIKYIDILNSFFVSILELLGSHLYHGTSELDVFYLISCFLFRNLIKARALKTARKKEEIKTAIKELIHSNINVTMYQVYKKTGISYKTLHKYYRDIFDEVLED